MTPSDFKTSQIALACWRAAPDDLHSVQLAVCQVFMNRAKAQGTDLYEEAVKWLEENPGTFPDPREPQFVQMLSKLDSVTSGMVTDKTGGALWFLRQGQLLNFLKAFEITTKIGSITFVK